MANFFWRRRIYDRFSQRFTKGSPLLEMNDLYFEDYCLCHQDQNSGLCLRTFGIRHSYPEYQEIYRISDRFRLYCVLSGKGYADGKTVQTGDIMMFDRDTHYNLLADEEDPFVFAWVTFKGENAEKYLSMINFKEGSHIYHIDHLEEICSLFYDILYVDHDTYDTALYLESRLIQLLSMLKEAYHIHSDDLEIRRQNKNISSAIVYIQEHCLQQAFRVSDVAKAVNMNEAYLRRLFQKEMKTSICKYVTEFRIHTAKSMLKSSGYNISEIAAFVGYHDYRQFYIQFKTKTGYTPSEYVEKMTKN